jgi:hypothetical protein
VAVSWRLGAVPHAGSLVLPVACAAALERATPQPLAFAIEHPANRLTAGGAAVAGVVTARLQRRFMAPRPVAQRSRRKNFCCVTTRRRTFWLVQWLRRRWDTPTARPLCLGVLGFDRLVLAPSGLPPRRLPTPDQTQAVGVLAVTLAPTPRLVAAATAFAQADPRPRSSRTATLVAVWLIMTAAHGSAFSQGSARGERAIVLLGRLSKPEADGHPPVYTSRA